MSGMTKADIINHCLQMARQGQAAQAAQQLQPLVQNYPGDPDFAHHLGLLLLSTQGGHDAAIDHLARSVQLAPANADYRSNYATALNMRARHAEAVPEYRRAVAIKPNSFSAQLGLSSALIAVQDYAAALTAARTANALDPARPEPWVNMSVALFRSGRGQEGLKTVEQGLARIPNHPVLLMQLVSNLHYLPDTDPDRIRREHEHVGRLIASGLPEPAALSNTRDPERPLRVGYLSPDFRDHSVSHFFRPILAGHKPEQVLPYCYSAVLNPDAVTAELKASATKWRDIKMVTDPGLEAQVRGDQIDILVDLAGHTAGSRVNALARRIAPVQVTYLGYPNTTGIPAMDYRIVDSLTDPAGAERYSTEQLIRLDPCFICYEPPFGAPPVTPEPAESGGGVTFGSFNAAQKIGEPVVRAWAGVLNAVHGSRLVLKSYAWGSAPTRKEFLSHFEKAGADPSRIEMLPHIPGQSEHLGAYSRVDIALDTFPYNGTTTTCEALYMGLPVVTVEGQAHAGRVGVSLLKAAGLPDLIAKSPEQYVQLAAALAGDRPRLARLRTTLRDQVRRSPLCDAPGFVTRLESAYRQIWRTYCESAKR